MPLSLPTWPPDWSSIRQSVQVSLENGDWGRYQSETSQQLTIDLISMLQPARQRNQPAVDLAPPAAVQLCCSGTAAIELALRLAKVGPGDEVVLCGYDYPGNLRTIELLGGRPVLVDAAPGRTSPGAQQVEQAICDQTAAVIVSHLYGQVADVVAIDQLCRQYGVVLIEDACQVPGMTLGGRVAGSIGSLGTLSFGGSKPLTAGNGGALIIRDERLAARLPALVDRPSDAFPLSPLQAAALRPQFKRLSELNRLRADTADHLAKQSTLSTWTPIHSNVATVEPCHYKFAWQARDADHRDRILRVAADAGLPIGLGFRHAANTSDRRCRKLGTLPNARALGETVLLLDHRALLTTPDQWPELVQALTDVHDQTRPSPSN
ncbi:MAG: aminotransferase class V-fold PLP-dependent enzyme [Planctomycetota bacterium]